MNIYIGRNGTVTGQFDLPALIEAIERGIVRHTDHAWHKGLRQWGMVREVIPPLLPPVSPRQEGASLAAYAA